MTVMIPLILTPHVYGFRNTSSAYLGAAINKPLPANFYERQEYIVGVVGGVCHYVNIGVSVGAGTNNVVVVGTSRGELDISLTVKDAYFRDLASAALNGVTPTRFFYVIFTSDGRILESGPISPGQLPSGQFGEPANPDSSPDIDMTKVMGRMMEIIMPMMGMMMVIQIMTGLMQSMTRMVM